MEIQSPAAAMHEPRWPDLPPELLREISSHMHNVADFVRFHAVCRPWRDSHEPTATIDHQFLPWLLAPCYKYVVTQAYDSLKFRCVFSNASYVAPPPISGGPMMNWVASADGTEVRYFTASGPHGPGLQDPLAGGPPTHLPDWNIASQLGEENPSGIIYKDGTVLLYCEHPSNPCSIEFRAALLRPSDDKWTFVRRTDIYPGTSGEFCVAYHAGKIFVTMEDNHWHVLTIPSAAVTTGDDALPRMPCDCRGYNCEHTYALESRNELLWASVHISMDYTEKGEQSIDRLVRALSVSVHALKEVGDGPEKMGWVSKDGWSLADRILFLGWPNSFAVDASRLGVSGGFAYFVYWDYEGNGLLHEQQHGVFRYNLMDDTTELVELLPQGWDTEMCTWLVPWPTIATIIQGPAATPRSNNMIRIARIHQGLAATQRSNNMIHIATTQHGLSNTPRSNNIIPIKRIYGPYFRVLVRNLPLTAKSSQLQYLFSKRGRVSNAEVIYYKKTKTSQGIGIVTMSTTHARHADALAALDRLVLDGYYLEVSLVKEGRRS